MSAEPQSEKEKTQEETEAPKREEDGIQPGKRKIPKWLKGTGVLLAAGLLAAVGGDVWKFVKSKLSSDRAPVTLAHQLRDPVRDFVGREEETRMLLAALKDRRPAVIFGGGGVGKTQLAYFVGKQLRGEFAAHIEVDMRGLDATPTTPAQAMEQVVLTLAPETKIPGTPGVLESLYRQMLTEQAVLVLADNASDSEQVRLLVPNPPSALLITSRQAIQLAEIERVELRDLPPAVSVMLLRKILAGRGLSDEELERLAAVCVHLPLALRVAGNYLAANPAVAVGDYISRIEAKRQELHWGGRDVMAQLAYSVESLERARADLVAQWRDLAVFPASFDREAAVAVARFEGGELDALVGRSLVIYDDDQERFRLHDLMRELAEEGWDEDAAYRARRRHAAHYLAVAGLANYAYLEGGEGVLAGLRLFDQERGQIEAGQAWAAGHAAEDDVAAVLAQGYPLHAAWVLGLRQHPREHIRWLEVSAEAARKLRNRDREGMAVGNLGTAYLPLGEPKRAIEYFGQHLVIARETGDRRGEGNALGSLGNAYRQLGEPKRAIEYLEQNLAVTRETGDRRGEGLTLGSLGNAYLQLGEPRRAIQYYEQNLAIARETGNRRGEGVTLGNLGAAYADLGEPQREIEYYEQHLAIARETGDRRGEGTALRNLGLAYADLGEPKRAIEYYEQQLAIARETEDRRREGNALGNLGSAYGDLGERQRAIEYYKQHLAIARETGDRRGEGLALQGLGVQRAVLGEMQRAIEYFEQHLAIARETADRRGEGQALGNLGLAYQQLGESKRAIEYYEQVLTIARETGDRRSEGIGLWKRALAFDKLGGRQEAISGAKAALDILEQIEHPTAEKVRRQLEDWGAAR